MLRVLITIAILTACFASESMAQYKCEYLEYRDPQNPNKAGTFVREEQGNRLILHITNIQQQCDALANRILGPDAPSPWGQRVAGSPHKYCEKVFGRIYVDAVAAAQTACATWRQGRISGTRYTCEVKSYFKTVQQGEREVLNSVRKEEGDRKTIYITNTQSAFDEIFIKSHGRERWKSLGLMRFLAPGDVGQRGMFKAAEEECREWRSKGRWSSTSVQPPPDKVIPPEHIDRNLGKDHCAKKRQEVIDSGRSTAPNGIIGYVTGSVGVIYVDYCEEGGRIIDSKGTAIKIGDCVRAGDKSRVRVQMADRDDLRDAGPSIINIGPNSKMCFDTFYSYFEEHNRAVHSGKYGDSWLGLIYGHIRVFLKGFGRNNSYNVRAGIALCGIRGSEVIVTYDPQTQTAGAYVKEGHAVMSSERTGGSRELTAGQSIIVDKGNLHAVKPMPAAVWDNLNRNLDIATRAATDISPASGIIPSLNATAFALRFFESGSVAVPYNERVYSKRFSSSTTRFIYYEIHLNYAAQPRVEFNIDAVWYRQDGTVVHRATKRTFLGPHSTRKKAAYSSGARISQANNFVPGSYRVELFIAGKKVASGNFEVY